MKENRRSGESSNQTTMGPRPITAPIRIVLVWLLITGEGVVKVRYTIVPR